MRHVQKSISDCIAPAKFVALTPDDTVSTAVAKMIELPSTCTLVVDGDELVGIFTERDYINRVCAEKRNPTQVSLGDVMTANPETLKPRNCISYAINRMARASYRHIPIVDDANKPVSVLDTRLVMTHLIKVFAELDRDASQEDHDWIDIGGGD